MSELVYLAWYSWCSGEYPGCDSGHTQEFAHCCFVVLYPIHMCGAAGVQAHAAMDGGAGVETEMPCRNVLSGAQVFRYCVSICRQQRLPTSRSKRQLAWCCLGGWPVLGKGVRTGGRLHPGRAGERLLKQRPMVGCLEDVGIAGFTEEASCTVLSCAPVVLHCDITCWQPRLTTYRSKRQLACCCLCVWPSARQRRLSGWTSTPRAGRGATAETTPKAMLLLSSASWLWDPSATSILVPGAGGCLLRNEAFVARLQTRPLHVGTVPFVTPVDPGDRDPSALLGQCLCAFRCIARAIAS